MALLITIVDQVLRLTLITVVVVPLRGAGAKFNFLLFFVFLFLFFGFEMGLWINCHMNLLYIYVKDHGNLVIDLRATVVIIDEYTATT